ncbi:VWA domain-containing protein [Verrucomicrobiota bacterium sgz303538]
MRLAAPEWLLLLPAIALAAWRWPELRLLRPARVLCMGLLVLVLTQPLLRKMADGIDLWVLVDRSASSAASMSTALPEMEAILERAKGTGDRLRIVDFAAAPLQRAEAESANLDPSETRTALAVEFTLGQLEADRLARILVLGDGYSTEPLAGVIDPLLQRGVPLDYRLLVPKAAVDFRVAGVELPQRVQGGESFLIEAHLVGTGDGDCPYVIERDGQEIGRGTAQIKQGEGRLRFTDRLRVAGGHRYRVHLTPTEDAHPENNHGEAWIEVSSTARVLVITAYDQDPITDTLRQHGFQVEQVTEPAKLSAGSLVGARLVVINNVPAHKLPNEFIQGVDFYVREQGGGLLMCGGRFSFGSGGYFSSAIDPLLPVSMELRKEHRKLRVAMAIVLDRSGSMAVPVSSGGGKPLRKMDLADEGAARAVELLGDSDFVSVLAVDSEPHSMVPMVEVGQSRDKIISAVRRIESQGGGIYVYQGLKGGWEELKKIDVGQRHLVLFADAADAEEPGAYKDLLDEMTKEGATVSVIGMGSETDSDANFLKDVAFRGKGRIMFNADPNELPAMFAQETVAVARSAFITDPVALKSTPGWLEIAARPMTWLGQVDGYNLSYLKPGATAAALSGDEYGAPLVAYWERGVGRSAAISFPVAGEKSDAVRNWPQYTDFVTTLARWLAGTDVPGGLGINSRLAGTQLELDLYYDESWSERIAGGDPRLVLSGSEPGTSRSVAWEKLAPGHFRARATLKPGELVRGAAQVGKVAVPFGPIVTASNAEWQFRREALTELRAVSERTGGKERLDLAQSWEAPPQRRFADLRPWLLVALLGAVVGEAFLTRIGRI